MNEKKYHVLFVLPDAEEGFSYSDVLHLSFIRVPMIKQASFAVIRLHVPPNVYLQSLHSLGDNEFPKVTLSISTLEVLTQAKRTVIFERQYNIVKARALTSLRSEQSTVVAEFVLCDPTILEMEQSLVYNPIHETVTAKEMIEDYESFIKDKYGDNFTFIKKLSEESSYIYEQVLIKPYKERLNLINGKEIQYNFTSDLDVPSFINFKYKPTDCFSYYYFDEFNLTSDKNLTAYFLSLYDPTLYEDFDITLRGDIYTQTRIVDTSEISDQFRSLDKENPVVTFKDIHGIYSTEKVSDDSLEKQDSQEQSDHNIDEEEKIVIKLKNQSFKKQSAGQSTNFLNIFTPDSVDQAKLRIEKINESMKNKLDYIATFQTTDCSFDWLQFNRVYNMSIDVPDAFLYLPISIWNVFRRIDSKEEWLNHNCRYQMLKFKKEGTTG